MIFNRRPKDLREDDDLAAREDPYNVTQASRIYILPNLMTAGNLFCGFMAVVNCIHARLAGLVRRRAVPRRRPPPTTTATRSISSSAPPSSTCSTAAGPDGRPRVPLWRRVRLAGRRRLLRVAPALLMFFLILSPSQGFPWFRDIGWFVGFIYLLCAAMRLARFNVITNPLLHRGKKESSKDFIGLPVPAAAMTVAALVLFLLKLADADKSLNRFALVLPFLMLLIAFLMMSTVRYPSGKKVDLQTQTRLRTFVFLLLILGLVVVFKEVAALGLPGLHFLRPDPPLAPRREGPGPAWPSIRTANIVWERVGRFRATSDLRITGHLPTTRPGIAHGPDFPGLLSRKHAVAGDSHPYTTTAVIHY
jgi:CDP-diacylglycerol--serine O-phosphatidyltransferase